jgi:predicted permease
MRNDVRFALRTLRRSPGFTFVVVLSLALGIGANTAIFSLLYQVALRSLPVQDPSRLISLQSDGPNFGWTRSDNRSAVFSYPMYVALRDHNEVFSGLIGRTSLPVTLSWGGEASRVRAEVVTGNFFTVLGVEPALGRLLATEDDARQNPVIVLSYGYWASRLGRDPRVLNSRVLVNSHPVLVIGVAPRGFQSLVSGQSPELFAPVSLMPMIWPARQRTDQVDYFWLNLFGRLRPGVLLQQANAALLPSYRSILQDHLRQTADVTEENRKAVLSKSLKVRPASQGINVLRDEWQSPLIVLLVMVGFVLLIACANVASLMVVRTTARRREMAVRFALGASRWQVSRQLMVESVILALAGGLLGLFVCELLTAGLLKLLPEDVAGSWLTAKTDFRLFAFSLALGMVTGVVFALIPALHALRLDLAPTLKEQGSGLTAADHRSRSRQAFVAAQICLSLLLLVGAGLFTRTLMNLMSTDPGFRADHLITFALDPSLSGHPRSRALALFRELEDRFRAMVPVKSVARAVFPPFGGHGWGMGVKAPGSRSASDKYVDCSQNAVSAGYFQTLGIPLLAGREFSSRDTENSSKVAILNETFARFLFENGDPIGRHIRSGSNEADTEIVGVVRDSKYGDVRERPTRFLYVPYEQAEPEIVQQSAFFIRTQADEQQMMVAIRTIANEVAVGVPIERMTSMDSLLARSIYKERLIASLAIAFGALATILAAVGLYGAISYSTGRRIREFGIRLALGADPKSLLTLVMREAAWLIAIGIAAGLTLSYALANVVRSQLYGIAAYDPWTFIGATVLIAVVTCCAALRPSLRAMKIDPVRALRHE